ncbi:MAG: hypothetical protein OEY59_11855 [Deltaproteobacteria bacterium]|nr:hypothetical protein [Deltaproteobacteria bacterium]
MPYETQQAFLAAVKGTPATDLVEQWLHNPLPHVFSDLPSRDRFFGAIKTDWPEISEIQCAGTSNWKYSLNPHKSFRLFSELSDIDVIAISEELFNTTWERMRILHRQRWYELPFFKREGLRRNGENIYSGFVCPKWIPSQHDALRFRFLTCLDRYSIAEVGFRSVNMFFFKNKYEVIDYYRRSVEIAKRGL